MKIQSLVIGALIATAAVPASAVTVVASFNGAGTNIASVSNTSNPHFTLTVSGRSYTGVASNALTTLTANSPTLRDLTRNAGGLGIVDGGSGAQMDTNSNTRREAFLVTGTAAFYLTNLTLSSVDSDDTLMIYGVRSNGTLRAYSYGTGTLATGTAAQITAARTAGAIIGGAGGSLLSNVRTAANGGTNAFGTGIVSGVGSEKFTRYLITTRVGGEVTYLGTLGQGFALSALTATVPEPATWAMLVVGFGLVGFARRRRTAVVAA
jgi:hypothetical protein